MTEVAPSPKGKTEAKGAAGPKFPGKRGIGKGSSGLKPLGGKKGIGGAGFPKGGRPGGLLAMPPQKKSTLQKMIFVVALLGGGAGIGFGYGMKEKAYPWAVWGGERAVRALAKWGILPGDAAPDSGAEPGTPDSDGASPEEGTGSEGTSPEGTSPEGTSPEGANPGETGPGEEPGAADPGSPTVPPETPPGP